MVTDELTRWIETGMGAGEGTHTGPDLARVRKLGRRRRRVRGAAGVGVVGVVAALLGGAVLVGGGPFAHDRVEVTPAAPSHHATGLSAYERRVLREVPGSYQVDGTVVVPGAVDTTSDVFRQRTRGEVSGPRRDLGFHAFVGVGYLPTAQVYPRFLTDDLPKGSQVVVDAGPVSLGCQGRPGKPCSVSVLARGPGGKPYFLSGLGSETFLQPGAEMQVFTDDDLSGGEWHATTIGGFDGTTATQVVLTLVGGARVSAVIDSGGLQAGATFFWARTDAEVASVTAYDAAGEVVARHTVRACSGGVDCEVR